MKKQLVSILCILFLSACVGGKTGERNATLADMFVWGQPEASVSRTVAVEHAENQHRTVTLKQENVTQEVKYVEVEIVEDGVSDEIKVQETIVTESPTATQPYNLAKKGERYEMADYVVTPQVYAIVATRTVNKMLVDAPAIFAENKQAPLFIDDTVYIDRYMPTSPDVAAKTVKDILHGSQMFNIVDSKEKADFVLSSSLNNVNTPEVPVFVYEIKLHDKDGKLRGSWKDSIRQVQNDDGSWW